MAEIQFFGEVDIHPTKHVVMSEYPAWYFNRQFESMKEEVDKMDRQLGRGEVPADRLADFKEELSKKRERVDRIASSIPKLSDSDKDRMAKVRKELSKIIKDGYFTRSSMMKGTADAHKEAERMVKALVDVKPEFADFVRACNVRISDDGKITRDGAVKTWKILGNLMNKYGADEDTDAETLRRD